MDRSGLLIYRQRGRTRSYSTVRRGKYPHLVGGGEVANSCMAGEISLGKLRQRDQGARNKG